MLEDEVRSAFATPDEIGGTALLKLPFLNACIQESLRLLPPVNGKISARICKGANLHGVYLPANVRQRPFSSLRSHSFRSH
jgi:cytochrome P450